MGDATNSLLYISLLTYLQEHGREAVEGVEERAKSPESAMEFIALLEVNRVPIFGLEVWRCAPNGYDVDVTSVWCAATDTYQQYEESRRFVRPSILAEARFCHHAA